MANRNDDIVKRLRDDCYECQQEAADEIERLRNDLDGSQLAYRGASYDRDRMRTERDEARLQTGRILTEIDCRIEHGAESNGHLEGIRNLFKNKK
jgi:hypothetical protein